MCLINSTLLGNGPKHRPTSVVNPGISVLNLSNSYGKDFGNLEAVPIAVIV
jgi:hypothetical protein